MHLLRRGLPARRDGIFGRHPGLLEDAPLTADDARKAMDRQRAVSGRSRHAGRNLAYELLASPAAIVWRKLPGRSLDIAALEVNNDAPWSTHDAAVLDFCIFSCQYWARDRGRVACSGIAWRPSEDGFGKHVCFLIMKMLPVADYTGL